MLEPPDDDELIEELRAAAEVFDPPPALSRAVAIAAFAMRHLGGAGDDTAVPKAILPEVAVEGTGRRVQLGHGSVTFHVRGEDVSGTIRPARPAALRLLSTLGATDGRSGPDGRFTLRRPGPGPVRLLVEASPGGWDATEWMAP